MAQDKQLRPESAEEREKNTNATYSNELTEHPRIAAGLITGGNFGAGYSVDTVGEDGQTITSHTKVRKMPGDAVLIFFPGEKEPSLLYSPIDLSDAGEGCLTVFSS
jgi:hypothetical protein